VRILSLRAVAGVTGGVYGIPLKGNRMFAPKQVSIPRAKRARDIAGGVYGIPLRASSERSRKEIRNRCEGVARNRARQRW
jgi:hypothetical protein